MDTLEFSKIWSVSIPRDLVPGDMLKDAFGHVHVFRYYDDDGDATTNRGLCFYTDGNRFNYNGPPVQAIIRKSTKKEDSDKIDKDAMWVMMHANCSGNTSAFRKRMKAIATRLNNGVPVITNRSVK